MRAVGLIVVLAGLLLTAAAPAQAFTVMSCWNGTGQDWLEHPVRCTYSTNGITARFEQLKWRGWGRSTATATGRRRTGGSRHRTRVQVRRLTQCGDVAVYYQQIRFKRRDARYSQWLPLTVPRC